MNQLSKQACEACRADVPKVDGEELKALLSDIPGWECVIEDGVMQLRRVCMFSNFKQAMAFSNQVGELAEEAGHHPAILTEWGKVTVTWWTHKIKGLHKNDFIMAARTDELLEAP